MNPDVNVLMEAIVKLAESGADQTLHPVMMNYFGLGLRETERLLEAEGLTFRRELMRWGGRMVEVSGLDEPFKRFRHEPGNRGFGLLIWKMEE